MTERCLRLRQLERECNKRKGKGFVDINLLGGFLEKINVLFT